MRLLFSTIPFVAALTSAVLLQGSGSAEACAGLIGSNGAVNLGRTTTLAAYHDGGGPDVAVWAEEHGFRLSPDAPEVLDFYAARSPIFLAAVFDGAAAAERGQQIGDGTPVHITIPTSNPWVPLRILGLGKQANDRTDADVFLLIDDTTAR